MWDRRAASRRLALILIGILAVGTLSTPAWTDGKGHDKGDHHPAPMKFKILKAVKTHDKHK